MKAILLSIKPEHALNILDGRKTLELRKSVPKDFVGWVYVYITKAKPFLEPRECNGEFVWNIHSDVIYHTDLNSKIPFRFWFDEYETYDFDNHGVNLYTDVEEYNVMYDDLERLCLDYREIETYGKGKDLYAWHIKKLEKFDKPMELSEFYKANIPYVGSADIEYALNYYGKDKVRSILKYTVIRAPQSYQYVWVKE